MNKHDRLKWGAPVVSSFAVLVLTAAVLVTAPVMMGESSAQAKSFKVTPTAIKVNKITYRRTEAESAVLGAIGEKKLGRTARFSKQFDWEAGGVDVKQVTTVSLTSKEATQTGTTAQVISSNGTGGGTVSTSNASRADYKIIKLEFSNKFRVAERLNAHKDSITWISKLKNKQVRIVSAVWVLVTGTESQMNGISGTLEGEANGGSGAFSVKKNGSVTFSFSPGTIVAYELSKFKWNKKRKNKRETIEVIQLDKFI